MLTILLSFLISVHAMADADFDGVLKNVGTSAAISMGESAGGQILDKSVTELPGLGKVHNVGTNVMFGVGIVLSAFEFANAKNDKGRLFASMDVIFAVTTLINPVVGLIAAVVVRLVDGIVSANGAKKLLEIYKQLAQHLKRIEELKKMGALSEFEIFKSSERRITKALRVIEADVPFNEYFCSHIESLNRADTIDTCLANFIELINANEVIVGQSRVLADFQSQYFNVDDFYKQNGMTREQFRQNADKRAEAVADLKARISEIRKYFIAATLELIKVQSEKKMASAKQILINNCVDESLNLIDDSVQTRLARLSARDIERLQIEKVTAGVVYQQMQDFAQSACIQLSKNDNSPNLRSAIQRFAQEYGQFKSEMSL